MDFFGHFHLWESISFTRRRHCRQHHMRLWPMRIMVPMGRVQVICDFRNYMYNYWTGNAIGFRASRERCSNFLFENLKYRSDAFYIFVNIRTSKTFVDKLETIISTRTFFLFISAIHKYLFCVDTVTRIMTSLWCQFMLR